jgi:hypothetical protein
MGGAFIGLSDDATAVSWNPAGLIQLEAPEASVVGLFETYTPVSDYPDYDADPWKSSHFNLNFASAAIPLSISDRNIVAAVAYQQMIDLFSSFDGDTLTNKTTGGVYAITPALGIQLTPAISIGASFNIYTGKTTTKVDYNEIYLNPIYYIDYEAEEKYSGTNVNIGAMIDLNKAQIGVVYKTPFSLTVKDDNSEWKFKMPQMLGIGAALFVSEKLTLAADFEMRKYSNTEFEYEDGSTSDPEFEDINQLRVGAEYLMMSGKSVLPLRLGFATTPTLYTDDNDDQIKGVNLTGGVGLIMGNINFDLGLEYNVYAQEIDTGYSTYNYSDNYFRFIVSGVFHFNK